MTEKPKTPWQPRVIEGGGVQIEQVQSDLESAKVFLERINEKIESLGWRDSVEDVSLKELSIVEVERIALRDLVELEPSISEAATSVLNVKVLAELKLGVETKIASLEDYLRDRLQELDE